MSRGKITAIGDITSNNDKDNPTLKSDTSGFGTTMYFTEFFDAQQYKRFINTIIRLVRSSEEYKNYIKLLRENIDTLSRDVILSNITSEDADIEFHHYPFTIYDVVDIVITNNTLKGKKITSFDIVSEVMRLHYSHMIGIVPLTKMNHDLAHGGHIFIRKDQIFGDWEKFMEEYDAAILPDHKGNIEELNKLTEEGTVSDIGGLF